MLSVPTVSRITQNDWMDCTEHSVRMGHGSSKHPYFDDYFLIFHFHSWTLQCPNPNHCTQFSYYTFHLPACEMSFTSSQNDVRIRSFHANHWRPVLRNLVSRNQDHLGNTSFTLPQRLTAMFYSCRAFTDYYALFPGDPLSPPAVAALTADNCKQN